MNYIFLLLLLEITCQTNPTEIHIYFLDDLKVLILFILLSVLFLLNSLSHSDIMRICISQIIKRVISIDKILIIHDTPWTFPSVFYLLPSNRQLSFETNTFEISQSSLINFYTVKLKLRNSRKIVKLSVADM